MQAVRKEGIGGQDVKGYGRRREEEKSRQGGREGEALSERRERWREGEGGRVVDAPRQRTHCDARISPFGHLISPKNRSKER